ncbi:sensor histidine kinase TmoS [mine drainage metagenome]|uniref:Sensor histidine kinase TmoS n=1 Tax=mine drainage metagenome TaxID=410659 RepID=A0A1J5PZ63_9ZZZZ
MKLPAVTGADHTLDFALLHQSATRHGARNRQALWWLLGLLALWLGSVVTLLLYLNNFEAEEAARRRAADAQWLEQSVQFHFRRLEDDLLVLARQQAEHNGHQAAPPADDSGSKAGLLWREPGVILASGWLTAEQLGDPRAGPKRWQTDGQANPENAQSLDLMQDTSRGLRRPAYAGLMLDKEGTATDVIWLAVPYFDRGEFVGNYLAAVSLERALAALIPLWYSLHHHVQLLTDESTPASDATYRVGLNLPGTDLFVQVALTGTPSATVPRIFFFVALLFLSGMLVSLFALRRDFVKRQQVQALLQAQVALRTAMENSVTLGLRAWDLQGNILYVNAAFARMVGYQASELMGMSPPFPYWPSEQIDHLRRVHEDIITQGTGGEGVEVQFQHRHGQLVDVLIHEAPLHSANGEQMGWMSSVLDISERKLAQRMAAQQQEKLEASGRLVAVGEVASTLAHELNQPLGALSSFANGLLNRLHANSIALPELLPVVQRMADLAERAGGIIKRVNAFARQRELSRQRLDLVAFLARVLSAAADTSQLAPRWAPPSGSIWVEADELLLEHLFSNLLSNAQDWADKGSQAAQIWVDLRCDNEQGMAIVSVSDTGPGVDETVVNTIFNAFISRKEGGMGMGLAICRSIVEAHHGRLEVGRDPVLGGARFTVLLPLAGTATTEPEMA